MLCFLWISIRDILVHWGISWWVSIFAKNNIWGAASSRQKASPDTSFCSQLTHISPFDILVLGPSYSHIYLVNNLLYRKVWTLPAHPPLSSFRDRVPFEHIVFLGVSVHLPWWIPLRPQGSRLLHFQFAEACDLQSHLVKHIPLLPTITSGTPICPRLPYTLYLEMHLRPGTLS